MIDFVINETHLGRLSPSARRELLQVLGEDVNRLKESFANLVWDPESNTSYPLTSEEAQVLVRGLPQPALSALRVFCENIDRGVGRGSLRNLLQAAHCSEYGDLAAELSAITQRLRTVTGNVDAWLFNWHAKDWVWKEEGKTYTKGGYFISEPALSSLAQALGLENSRTS